MELQRRVAVLGIMETSASPASAGRPALPKADKAAFLLDFDGTLVDIAPAPELVQVPPGLADALLRLRALCGDALAVVTGRPIAQIDGFLPGVPFAVAGEHGTAVRHAPGDAVKRADLPALPPEWLDRAEQLAATHDGVRVERKGAGFVLHYRANPAAGAILKHEAEAMVAADGRFHVQPAKMAWEIRPAGIDKGSAVAALMQRAPFAGRLPVFIGDDVTDEDGIRAAIALGGTGYRIPDDFDEPESVRRWLTALAAGEERAWAV
jgi:trehalose 6-phosphate phosphatase